MAFQLTLLSKVSFRFYRRLSGSPTFLIWTDGLAPRPVSALGIYLLDLGRCSVGDDSCLWAFASPTTALEIQLIGIKSKRTKNMQWKSDITSITRS